jgi:Trypsin
VPKLRLVASIGSLVLASTFLHQPAIAGGEAVETGGDEVTYAELVGVSLSEARRRIGLQIEAGVLELALSAAYPNTFGGLWVEHSPAFRVVIYLTAGDAATVLKFASPELADTMEVRRVARSREQLQSDAESVARALPDGVSVTVRTRENEVVVEGRSASSSSLIAAARSDAPSSVRFIESAIVDVPAVDIYGGLFLRTCTAGFSVKQNGVASTGTLTAGHCSDSQTFSGAAMTYKQGLLSGSHDEQWHTSSFTEVAKFRVDPNGTTRPVTAKVSRSTTPDGGMVCKYGNESQYGCGFLVSKSHAPSYVPNAQPTFMQVHFDGRDLASSGDSGGPVFLGQSAYGIVSGARGVDGQPSDLIYVAINYPESQLGVTVLMQ